MPAPESHAKVRQIYVALLDEGTDVYRPVDAVSCGEGVFQIVSPNAHPGDERWQFTTGDYVRCRLRIFSGGVQGQVAFQRTSPRRG